MKVVIFGFLLAIAVIVDCGHTFLGTNVGRPMVYHHNVEYSSKLFQKRIETLYFSMPAVPSNFGRSIQGLTYLSGTPPLDYKASFQRATLAIGTGILAYDLTHTDASMNVTQGGLGYNFVNFRIKSARGTKINFDVYIYA